MIFWGEGMGLRRRGVKVCSSRRRRCVVHEALDESSGCTKSVSLILTCFLFFEKDFFAIFAFDRILMCCLVHVRT